MDIIELIKSLQDLKIPVILVVSGIIFILLSLAGGFIGKISIPPKRQKWCGIIGTIFLVIGIILSIPKHTVHQQIAPIHKLDEKAEPATLPKGKKFSKEETLRQSPRTEIEKEKEMKRRWEETYGTDF